MTHTVLGAMGGFKITYAPGIPKDSDEFKYVWIRARAFLTVMRLRRRQWGAPPYEGRHRHPNYAEWSEADYHKIVMAEIKPWGVAKYLEMREERGWK